MTPRRPSAATTALRDAEASPDRDGGGDGDEPPRPPEDMRLSEIQSELRGMDVPYVDCFDRESLSQRLLDARDGTYERPAAVRGGGGNEERRANEKGRTDDAGGEASSSEGPAAATTTAARAEPEATTPETAAAAAPPRVEFDRDAVVSELRSLHASELRSRLGQRNVRWGGMIEKEDLVQALADAMERSSNFSLSGSLSPGEVGDIDEDVLAAELAGEAGTPLLLDVYATWCGPCQMMAPQLKAAAAALGDTARVAKLDSDKYPNWAGKLKVGGLPTVLVFSREGKEVERVEGALMKDMLVDLVRQHL